MSFIRKGLLAAIVIMTGIYGYMLFDHHRFITAVEHLNESTHQLEVTTQKMADWQVCASQIEPEGQYLCNSMIGYPQDLLRDYQKQKADIEASAKLIGEHSQ